MRPGSRLVGDPGQLPRYDVDQVQGEPLFRLGGLGGMALDLLDEPAGRLLGRLFAILGPLEPGHSSHGKRPARLRIPAGFSSRPFLPCVGLLRLAFSRTVDQTRFISSPIAVDAAGRPDRHSSPVGHIARRPVGDEDPERRPPSRSTTTPRKGWGASASRLHSGRPGRWRFASHRETSRPNPASWDRGEDRGDDSCRQRRPPRCPIAPGGRGRCTSTLRASGENRA